MNPAAPHSGTPGAGSGEPSVPGTYSPAPRHSNRANAEGYDGYPSKPSDCAGRAKMHVRQTRAGRVSKRLNEAKQSQAVTFSHSVRRAVQPPRAPRAPDGIGRGLSGFLPLLSRARHLPLQEIFPQPAHVRQDSPGCISDVGQSFRVVSFAAVHEGQCSGEVRQGRVRA